LRAYVAEASEKALSRGRELGKLSVQAGLDSSDIATAHLEALQADAWPDEITGELVIERSSRFLLETLQPFSSARHRLEQMSRELAEMNDTLIERSKELEIANTELETFSYSISHDLRTSLQAVLGFAQTLDARHSQNLPPQARRCIELIIKGARGMNELVNDLLELALCSSWLRPSVCRSSSNRSISICWPARRSVSWSRRSPPPMPIWCSASCRFSTPTACCSSEYS